MNLSNFIYAYIKKNRTPLFLSFIFIVTFLLKIYPIFLGYMVPLGWVDTSYHISTALDVSEGNIESMIRPWWHLKNHYIINGYDIVDRNSTSFFYPPLIHVLLAIGFLFIHPGLATIIIISFLYSLSVIAIFLLCRSFKFKDVPSLISASIVALSIPLVYSQNYGFWSFAIALNFLIISYSLLRFNSRKYRLISVLFSFFAVLTHWTFLILVILGGLIELIVNKNKEAKLYIGLSALSVSPFLIYFFHLSSPLSHIPTHLNKLFYPNYYLVLLAFIGFILTFRKYKIITLYSFLALLSLFFYFVLKIKFMFGDMVQFVFPLVISFYVAGLIQNIKNKFFKIILITSILLCLVFNFITIQNMSYNFNPSISNEQFDELLKIRSDFNYDGNTLLAIDSKFSPWITIVAKNSKILYPFSYEGINMEEYYRNYVIGEINTSIDYKFYRLINQNNSFILNKK